MLYHEFHSLSLSVLDVDRAGRHAQTWKPLAPGIRMVPIPGAPTPAPSAPQRIAQMRTLTRDFSASTVERQARTWELRLLPQPLYRYESTDPVLLDGAIFSFVTSARTDPEALLVIEARKPNRDESSIWHYALARFTDLQLTVRYKGDEVFYCRANPGELARSRWQGPRPRVPRSEHTGGRRQGPMSRQAASCLFEDRCQPRQHLIRESRRGRDFENGGDAIHGSYLGGPTGTGDESGGGDGASDDTGGGGASESATGGCGVSAARGGFGAGLLRSVPVSGGGGVRGAPVRSLEGGVGKVSPLLNVGRARGARSEDRCAAGVGAGPSWSRSDL